MTGGDDPRAWANPAGEEAPDASPHLDPPSWPARLPPPQPPPALAPPAQVPPAQAPPAKASAAQVPPDQVPQSAPPTQPNYGQPWMYPPPTQHHPAQFHPAQYRPARPGPAQYRPAQYRPTQYRPTQYGGPPSHAPYGPYTWAAGPVPPAPPRRRRWLRWVVGALAVMLVCSVGGVGGLAALARYVGALDRSAQMKAGLVPTLAAPAASAPDAEWRRWAFAAADKVAKVQAAALLSGDEAGYLATIDPAKTTLVTEQRRRFKLLRELGVGVWRQTVTGTPAEARSNSWRLDLVVFYCFGPSTCDPAKLQVRSEWTYKNERLLLSDLKDSDKTWNGPRPWEVDDLRVVVGTRAVVAATKVNAWRLPDAIKAADAAAAVADRFAKWHKAPERYVIFLAGPTDWKTWYGREQPKWAAARAVPVGTYASEVVVRTEVVNQAELKGLLAHELTHVTTLAGDLDGASLAAWWLIEGIAEYAQFRDRSVRGYEAFGPLRTFVRGKWNGDPAVASPGSSASVADAAGRYGVAYLAVRRIADKHGESKMLEFWGSVVHDGDSLDAAARTALGASWSTVKADCARYVRSAVA